MRIAIDLITAEYVPGGMLLATRALLHGLARVDRNNEYVVVTVRPEAYQELAKFPNIQVHAASLPLNRGILIQHQLLGARIIRSVKPDLLHTPAFATPRGWYGPLVTTVNDLAFLKVPEQSSWYPRFYHEHLLRASVDKSQRVIAISEQTREELTTYWSVPTKKIHLIHHALRPEISECHISEEDIVRMRQRYGPRYLLHVGRIMPRKNVERLLEAFDLLAGDSEDLHLVLTGGLGYGSEEAVQLMEKSPYRERIHQVGWVPEAEMGAIYAGASALVFPSKHEGQGLPTLEAMVCGTPVVASYEAASAEIAGDAVLRANCTSARPLADAIRHVLTNEELRRRLIQNGHQQVKAFHYENCARQTMEVYQEAKDSYQQSGAEANT
ncbi:glycosyltransferase family 4 protein [Dictyobacter formicarum]|uniref:Glycosyl transferase family 1 n=1 Tax=Dictyobacter formicarum TaxID=2778368 RepID=A0ABQ3V8H2_9CHLR|nr:glycosyltransferase family 1 protein [Dictyobacter formicarum]GHO82123.1 glycosyl transferase family 1 [Dictyobacter formicarum]